MDVRKGGAPDPEGAGKNADADRVERADDGPTRARSRRAQRPGAGTLSVSQARPGMGKGDPPGRREAHTSIQAFQEGTAEMVFQCLDLMREARLADVQARRGSCEGAVIDHRDEVLELAQRDCHAEILSVLVYLCVGQIAVVPSRSWHGAQMPR